jgi:hypothetical protein
VDGGQDGSHLVQSGPVGPHRIGVGRQPFHQVGGIAARVAVGVETELLGAGTAVPASSRCAAASCVTSCAPWLRHGSSVTSRSTECSPRSG